MIEHIVFFALVSVVLFALLRHDKEVREEIIREVAEARWRAWISQLKITVNSAPLEASIEMASRAIAKFAQDVSDSADRISRAFQKRNLP